MEAIPQRLLAASGLLLTAMVMASPALAGSATADSVWDRKNALGRAMEQMPAGATLTNQRCQEIGVRMDNIRYRCTVWWTTGPGDTP